MKDYNALYIVCQEQRGTIYGIKKKGSREMGFIGFVRLIGFIGLRKQAYVESDMPLARTFHET